MLFSGVQVTQKFDSFLRFGEIIFKMGADFGYFL
jgi:hypothetical protein